MTFILHGAFLCTFAATCFANAYQSATTCGDGTCGGAFADENYVASTLARMEADDFAVHLLQRRASEQSSSRARSLDLSTVKHNNLGGYGPGNGSPEIRYGPVTQLPDGRDVDLVVTADRDEPFNQHGNGLKEKFWGRITQASGSTYGYTFSFEDSDTHSQVSVDNVVFSVFDVDGNPWQEVEESVTVCDLQSADSVYLAASTSLGVSRRGDCVTVKPSTMEGSPNVKGTSVNALTDVQKAHAFSVAFSEISTFHLSTSITPRSKGNTEARALIFAGAEIVDFVEAAACVPNSEAACSAAAAKLGLELGGMGYSFSGSYSTKGCYAYSSGKYDGHAYYSTGGTDTENTAPISDTAKYRPTGYDCEEACVPYGYQACRAAATELGLQLGGESYSFSGSYSTKGCYAYSSGQYAGQAYYSTGGTETENTAPISDTAKYRPTGYDCEESCEPNSYQACRAAATQLGLELGGASHSFRGSYSTKGCYAYSSGEYDGQAYYSTGGTETENTATISDTAKYRPNGYDCEDACVPYDYQACRAAATKLGLQLGSESYSFSGSYSTKGCYAYSRGQYAGQAYYSAGGTETDNSATPLNTAQYRPAGYDCE